jgi:hypothetical protein
LIWGILASLLHEASVTAYKTCNEFEVSGMLMLGP